MTTVDTREALQHIHTMNYRSGVSSVLVQQESAGTYYGVYIFQRFNPFYEAINNMMINLAAGGIYEFCEKNFHNPKGLNMKIDGTGPQILTMEHLMVGFHIWLVPLIISMIVFGLEIAAKYYKKFMPNMKNFLRHKMHELMKPKQQKIRANHEAKKKKIRR